MAIPTEFKVPDESLKFWQYEHLCVRLAWIRIREHAFMELLATLCSVIAIALVTYLAAPGENLKVAVLGAIITLLLVIILIGLIALTRAPHDLYEVLREERNRLRRDRGDELLELKGLRRHIDEMLKDVKDDYEPDSTANSSIWINAGQDVIEARAWGLYEEPRYVALRSILNAAENGRHLWQINQPGEPVRPILFGIFRTLVSWHEKHDEHASKQISEKPGDLLRYGLRKFREDLNIRIQKVQERLRRDGLGTRNVDASH